MKVILRQDYESLGNFGEIVEVKNGFARNFLIPRKIALEATQKNVKFFEQENLREEITHSKNKRAAELLAKKLEKISLTATVAVGEEDKVFGAVTSQVLTDLLKEKAFHIDRRKIQLDEPLKALGVYEVPIKLHPEVEVKIKVWVVKE